jgi:ParB family chromosome partitioning protein
MDELARDIAARGILQPIVVGTADERGRYRIRFGSKCWRAARQAGLAEVPVTVARRLGPDLTTVGHHPALLDLPPVLDAAMKTGRCASPRTL